MDNVAILLNPSAGKGKALNRKSTVENCFRRMEIPYNLFVSESEDHLRKLARRMVQHNEYRAIIGVGGDTTLKIIAAEILEFKYKNTSPGKNEKQAPSISPVLGMIGMGSANDIGRSLGVLEIDRLCHSIRQGITHHLDVGCVKVLKKSGPAEDRQYQGEKYFPVEQQFWFLGSLSLGLGAAVNRFVEDFCQQHPKLVQMPILNQVWPALLGIRRAFASGMVPMEIEMEYGETKRNVEFSLLVFLNIPDYANGIRFSSQVSPFDGQLEAVNIHTTSLSRTVGFALQLLRKKHKEHPAFEMISAPTFRVSSRQPLDIQLDGDIIPDVETFEVSLWPACLEIYTALPAAEK